MRPYSSLYVVFAVTFLICGALMGQPARCTQDTVVGTYALVTQGTMIMPAAGAAGPVSVPSAALGIVSIDAGGTITGTATMSMGGDISQTPWPGAIQVKPDCNAVVNWAGGTTGAAVIMDEGKEIRSIMLSATAAKGIVQAQWKRVSRVTSAVESTQCSPASVHGVYAASYQGIQIGTPPGATQPMSMPTVMVSLVSVDYQGQISGGGTMSLAGDPVPFQVVRGTLDVNPDCSAVTQMALDAGPLSNEGTGWMVVLDGGNELWSLPTQSNSGKTIAFGSWKRISPVPAANSK
jgi:hypothetical protein